MKKKKCIAMLLAGGQGTRLAALTSDLAKPAVSFGSKYRIIDFTLSNCSNSDIDTVGILTQYQPLILNEYIAGGEPWDLDRTYGGTFILPPYQAKKEAVWYKGTANAIYQNISFLDRFDSEHVLILSGDHIYRMNYSLMLSQHIEKDADCTIAVIDVELSDAHRFGIMDYDKSYRITSFDEKPSQPKSNHASMGVYIFKKDSLVKELIEDEADPKSSNDFGKNIIPKMLASGKKMYSYEFKGYWKDVGTIRSLWEANMDLLGNTPALNLYKSKIYSRNQPLPPLYIAKSGSTVNSICTAGCEIYGTVVNSILSEDVIVGEGSTIVDSIIMRGVVIGKNVRIQSAIIDENARILDGTVIGDELSSPDRIALIARGVKINENSRIKSDEIIDL